MIFAENDHLSTKDELVLNALSTLNNLSFYSVADNAVAKQQKRVADGEWHTCMSVISWIASRHDVVSSLQLSLASSAATTSTCSPRHCASSAT